MSTHRERPEPLAQSATTAGPSADAALRVLDRAFSRFAGADRAIDVTELRQTLNLRTDFLARRLVSILDRNGDGRIERDEFLDAVHRLVFGSAQEKLQLAFGIHDLDGDGRLQRGEIAQMMTMGLNEELGDETSGVESSRRRTVQVQQLTELVFALADVDRDGTLSLAEFERIVQQDAQLLDLIARSELYWLGPGETVGPVMPPRHPWHVRLSRVLQNRRTLLGFWGVSVVFAAFLFIRGILGFRSGGSWLMLAHGCGAALNFAGALVIIPVMRRLLSWLRGTAIARWLPLDDAITVHRVVGVGIVILGVTHTMGHLMYRHSHGGIFPWLTHYGFAQTGLVLLASTLLMWSFALPVVRKTRRFEWFYFTHSGYLLWFALMLAHGRHFYAWATLPLLAYATERVVRWRRHSQAVEIVSLTGLKSGVSRLGIRCPPDFRHQAGDYAFLRIPVLARYEWHPFTISSAPGLPNISFHIRSEGDWTKALRRLADEQRGNVTLPPLIAYLDGPFGSSNADIFKSRFPVLIGAGIGITPYASVLESLVIRANAQDTDLQKLYFYWLNRESRCFEWFADLLLRLERVDRNQRVEIRIFMTGGCGHIAATALNLARDLSHRLGRPDWATGLRTQTGIGAPDFDRELREIAACHAPDAVDVYFCGPPGLGSKVKRICDAQSILFRAESF